MKKFFYIVLFIIIFYESAWCQHDGDKNNSISVEVDTLLLGKISVRAIMIDGNKVWYAADQGRFGCYDLNAKKNVEEVISLDSIKPEFRSIAKNSNSVFILNAGSRSLLYKIDKNDYSRRIVYSENHYKSFYDSMQFWNDKEGIALGDPIDDCFSILITRDGGNNWNKLKCSILPKVEEGEAAFAASNTNIVIKGNKCWIVSGGKKARVFYSADKGKRWKVFETPVIQGGLMTGIFSADFYDEKNGFIAGGDYEKLQQNTSNKALTNDGGKTWNLISINSAFGYTSCVQYVPFGNGKQLVSVGASGLFYTNDNGETWRQLLKDADLYTIRFIDRNTAIAAGKNKIIKIAFRKKI